MKNLDTSALEEEENISPLQAEPSIKNDTLIALAQHIKHVLALLGEDGNREGLEKTPLRVAKALTFLTSGMAQEDEVKTILTKALFTQDYSEMVLVKDIEFHSLCEHHLLPFYGKVHVAYLPHQQIVGLSKIPRIVDIYARRLQLQERMTVQIRDALQTHLNPKGVAVVIEARHMCMMLRGVRKQQSSMITSALSGLFLTDAKTRQEFMQLIK